MCSGTPHSVQTPHELAGARVQANSFRPPSRLFWTRSAPNSCFSMLLRTPSQPLENAPLCFHALMNSSCTLPNARLSAKMSSCDASIFGWRVARTRPWLGSLSLGSWCCGCIACCAKKSITTSSGAGVETRDVPVWVLVLSRGGTDKLMGPSACPAPASDRAKPSSGATALV